MKFDRDIDKHDILELSNPDAITGFFADLGYNTDIRTEQSPGNLGITAEGVLRQIKRIELIADQEGLLQVYLFVMKSVTVTGTRGLARSFRNRTGNYLLVLTDDYKQIDFVLIEKYLPQKKSTAKLVGQPHVGVRPRSLTVDRRKPDAVHLRVLRRFTYTESDPFSQYDKLESAYAIADWSEQFFNNRALFSDHYLMNRVPDLPEWKHDSKPTYRLLNDLYKDVANRVVNKGESVLHDDLVIPCLNALGFKAEKAPKSKSDKPGPDYTLHTQKTPNTQLSMCLVYPWMRYLDGKDYKRDSEERRDENPGQKVVSLLEAEDAPDWALVTNGKIWRLYSKRTHAKATNYYEIDLEEILSQGGPHAGGPGDAFRYFWLIFRSEAFILESSNVEGEERQLSFLDRLLTESDIYAKELGERLKERVFEDVFPLLAKGFIAHIRDRDGINTDLSQDALDEVFLGTLTLLYRILFLLYAEARDLLPVKEVRGYYEASQRKVTEEIADAAGDLQDESYGKLKRAYYIDDYKLYDRLHNLFKVIDLGDETRNVPVYNGGLFITDPPDDEHSADVRNARFLATTKVPDRYLAQALDFLARDLDPKRHDLVFVDYKSLGVRQLGSIYEGLLEFKLRVATGKMAIVKGKKAEEVIPYSEATKKKRKILTIGRGKSAKERVYKKGDVYLENDKKERKASGSYYTPDHIVKYIVEHTVGPVLEEKFEAMRPKLREAQMRYKAWQDRQKRMKVPNPESQADSIAAELADELFDIKVLDPAMGSGHFLVEAVDFITDKALDFLNAFPWNPIIAKLERTRHEILDEMENQGITVDQNRLTDVNLLKRHVLKRCIYGVDLNPMAVELAKVSLWLDCFTLGAPLSFLDHHMKCGNSLIGVTIEEVDKAITGGGTELGLFSKPMQSLKASLKTMLEIGDLPDVTPAQVKNSRNLYESALAKTQPVKRLLDIYTSRWFGNTPEKSSGRGKKKTKARDIPLEFLNSQESTAYRDAVDDKALKKAVAKLPAEFREMVEIAEQDSDEKRFFHWEMEFPEVFYKPREDAPEQVERMDGAGFDAVIGNPPYDVLETRGSNSSGSYISQFLNASKVYGPALLGNRNLFKLFICRGVDILNTGGWFSFIVPMALLGDKTNVKVRRLLIEDTSLVLIESFPQKDDPRKRIFSDAKLSTAIFVTTKQRLGSRVTIRTHTGKAIDALTPALSVRPELFRVLDPENYTLPSCTHRDWEIVSELLRCKPFRRLGEFCECSNGEVMETIDTKKGFISRKEGDGPKVLRGSTICMYVVREQSQGTDMYLLKDKFLNEKSSGKIEHHRAERVGWQESSPQNNFRRIIAAKIPKGEFCNHKINYIPECDSKLPLDFVLAILDCQLSDWYFRIGSTNNAVSHYQIGNLPVPEIIEAPNNSDWESMLKTRKYSDLRIHLKQQSPEPGRLSSNVMKCISAMSMSMQDIEGKRILTKRSERSHLATESQSIQDEIDAIIFWCYRISDDDADYIKMRLKEML